MRGEPTIKGGAASAIAKQQSDFQNSVSSKVQVTGSYSRIWNGVTVKAADDGLAEIHRNKAVVGIFPVVEVERPEVKVDRSAKPDMFTARSISGVGYAQQELGLSGKGVKMILANSSAFRLAPPTSAPSTSGWAMMSTTFEDLTEPPY